MMKRLALIVSFLACVTGAAGAQSTVKLCYGQPCVPVNATNPLPVSGTFSASLAGFPTTQTTGTPIAVTTGGVTGTLPAGTVVVASNVGATNGAYCKLGASATTSDQLIPPNSWFAFTVGASTQLTCITSSSTTTVNMVGGSGLPTGSGGGGGGSGGGGAITAASGAFASGALSSGSVASGAMVDLGAIADAASTAGGTGTLSAKLRLMTTQLGTLNTTLGSPFQAGGSIANTTFAATQATSSNLKAQVDPLTATSWGINTLGSTTSGQSGQIAMGAVTTASPTYTTAQTNALSLDTTGALRVNVTAGGAGGGAITAASGSYASGALSAGSIAAGAAVDGSDLTQGAKADSACGTATGTCSMVALTKFLNTAATAPTPAQTGIGNVNIGAVQNAGSKYIAVAASQTATVLQSSTGAAGDYLSHCVIYPASTSPGVVTVFDNTNTAATSAILFAGGATSTSNLTPISVPVGALSTAGAWKVTTGANVSVVCFGKFS